MTLNESLIEDFSQQYQAALKMAGNVIDKCKDDLWQDYTKEVIINQLVYHILTSADRSLSKTNEERRAFKEKYGNSNFPFNDTNKKFTKKQLEDYLEEIKLKADKMFQNISIEELTKKSIFDFRGTISLYSVLTNNLRHLMLHTGVLHARLNILDNETFPYVNAIYRDERDRINDLNDQGVAYILAGKIDEAEKIYLEICDNTENPLYLYNFACVNSHKGYKEKALNALKTCLKFDNGNLFKNLAKNDSDFTNIKDLSEFKQLIS